MSRPAVHYLRMGPWPYFVGFTTSDDDFRREMRRLKIKGEPRFINGGNSSATTHFLTREGHGGTAIVCMEPMTPKRTREQYAALLAHEATHVVQDMRRELGELGPEAEAYIVQHIVQSGLQIAWNTGKVSREEPVA